jgi:transcriptional regulator with XRE-family HTH domain
MNTFSFIIIASGIDPEEENFEDRFFEAGCDDATISFQKGALVLEFDRQAKNLSQALFSAILDVTAAGAKVLHVEPDYLVSLSDIAQRSGLSRSAATLYAKGERGQDFPAPIARVTTESPLWDWLSVARWFKKRRQLGRNVVVQAKIMRETNLAIQRGELRRSVFARRLADGSGPS